MTCKEAIAKLAEYLDAELTPAVVAQLEAHLRECAPCRAYLATYRKTKELAAKVNRHARGSEDAPPRAPRRSDPQNVLARPAAGDGVGRDPDRFPTCRESDDARGVCPNGESLWRVCHG